MDKLKKKCIIYKHETREFKMTVNDLILIHNYCLEHHISLNYDNLSQYAQKDINMIIERIQENNQNIEVLLTFLTFELQNPNWKQDFSHLKVKVDFDIRTYIITKILDANSIEQATRIYHYFNDNSFLELASTVGEWKTYVDNITADMTDFTVSNVLTVLTNENSNKWALITQVMKYSQNKNLDSKEMSKYIESSILEKYLEQVISLLNHGYPITDINSFFMKWENDLNTSNETNISQKEIDSHYEYTFHYLENNFSTLEEKPDLLKILNSTCHTEYGKVVSFLQKIETQKDKELFGKVLKYKNVACPAVKIYYMEILLAPVDMFKNYRNSLLQLLDEGVVIRYMNNENTIQKILHLLKLSSQYDEDIQDITDFISQVPFSIINNKISIEKDNCSTRKIIYTEFPKCLKQKITTEEEILYYGDWIEKLCVLPSDICQKILMILKLSIVKKLSLSKQVKLKQLLLSKENFGSLDYVYNRYLEKERELNISNENPENNLVHLQTVIESLQNGVDIREVLKGFKGDDEITQKTLIRSFEHKNNENN